MKKILVLLSLLTASVFVQAEEYNVTLKNNGKASFYITELKMAPNSAYYCGNSSTMNQQISPGDSYSMSIPCDYNGPCTKKKLANKTCNENLVVTGHDGCGGAPLSASVQPGKTYTINFKQAPAATLTKQ